MPLKHLTVIPAKAGIQLNALCEALKTYIGSFGRIFDWIPAFAGMTVRQGAG